MTWVSRMPLFWRVSLTNALVFLVGTLVLLFSLEFILINLVVDVLYGLINPTIRYR